TAAVAHGHAGAAGQRPVGDAQGRILERLAAGRPMTVEAGPVPRRLGGPEHGHAARVVPAPAGNQVAVGGDMGAEGAGAMRMPDGPEAATLAGVRMDRAAANADADPSPRIPRGDATPDRHAVTHHPATRHSAVRPGADP